MHTLSLSICHFRYYFPAYIIVLIISLKILHAFLKFSNLLSTNLISSKINCSTASNCSLLRSTFRNYILLPRLGNAHLRVALWTTPSLCSVDFLASIPTLYTHKMDPHCTHVFTVRLQFHMHINYHPRRKWQTFVIN